jgi:hypothetical protein
MVLVVCLLVWIVVVVVVVIVYERLGMIVIKILINMIVLL